MISSIGAGGRIWMGDAAAPMNTANGGAGSDADLDDVSEYLGNFSFSSSQGTVDVTKLTADADGHWRKFIAGLRSGTANFNYGDNSSGFMVRRVDAIMSGSNHVNGRGKVDMRWRPFGTASGKVQFDFTVIPTDLPYGGEIEAEVGGSVSWQITGQVTISTQA